MIFYPTSISSGKIASFTIKKIRKYISLHKKCYLKLKRFIANILIVENPNKLKRSLHGIN